MGNKIIYMAGNGAVEVSKDDKHLVVTADKGYVFGVTDKTYLAQEKIQSAVSDMGVAARMAKRGIFDGLRTKKAVNGFILWADAAAVNSFKHGTDGSATLHIVRGITKTDSGLSADSVVTYGDSAGLFVWPPTEACIGVCDRLALSIDDDARRASMDAAKRAADKTSMANIMSYLNVVEDCLDQLTAGSGKELDPQEEHDRVVDARAGLDALAAAYADVPREDEIGGESIVSTLSEALQRNCAEYERKLAQSPIKGIIEFVSAYRRARPELIRVTSELAKEYGIPFDPDNIPATCPRVSTMAEVAKTTKPCATRPGQFDTKGKPLSKCGRAHRAQEPIDMPTPPQGRRHVGPMKSVPGDRCRFDAAGKLVEKATKKAAKKVAKKASKKAVKQ